MVFAAGHRPVIAADSAVGGDFTLTPAIRPEFNEKRHSGLLCVLFSQAYRKTHNQIRLQ